LKKKMKKMTCIIVLLFVCGFITIYYFQLNVNVKNFIFPKGESLSTPVDQFRKRKQKLVLKKLHNHQHYVPQTKVMRPDKATIQPFDEIDSDFTEVTDEELDEFHGTDDLNEFHGTDDSNEGIIRRLPVDIPSTTQSFINNENNIIQNVKPTDSSSIFVSTDSYDKNLVTANPDDNDILKPQVLPSNQHVGELRNSHFKSIDTTGIPKAKGEFKRRYPQAIIAGVKKCGTRALLSFLAKHPSVHSAGPEMHFFDKNENYQKGLKWYLNQMPESYENELTMEKTPAYFVKPEVPERVYSLSPNVKLIFIFRNPVQRAISDYTQHKSKTEGSKTFEKIVYIKNVKPRQININSSKINIGLYATHLKKWLKHFPMKQMFFVDGDAFIKDPVPSIIEVQKFLNIPVLMDRNSFTYNSTKGFYCINVKTAGTSSNATMDCLGPSKGRKQADVKENTLKRMREFYKPYNKEFFNLIDQDFGWET